MTHAKSRSNQVYYGRRVRLPGTISVWHRLSLLPTEIEGYIDTVESRLRRWIYEDLTIEERKSEYEWLRDEALPRLEREHQTIHEAVTEYGPGVFGMATQDSALVRIHDRLAFHVGRPMLGQRPEGDSLAIRLEGVGAHLGQLADLRSYVRELAGVANAILELPVNVGGFRGWRDALQRWVEADMPNDYRPNKGRNLGLLGGPRAGIHLQHLLGEAFEILVAKLEFRRDKAIDHLTGLLQEKRDKVIRVLPGMPQCTSHTRGDGPFEIDRKTEPSILAQTVMVHREKNQLTYGPDQRIGFDSISFGRIKEEFIRAAESFPNLIYVYMEWDVKGSAPEVPADFTFDANSPSRNMIVSTPYSRGDERAALSWLAKPNDQPWKIEEARDRLRAVIFSSSDFDTEGEWLFSLRDVLGARKCRLYAVADFGKMNCFSVGGRGCRRAKPGEAFFQVVEDLFQRCAVVCGNRAFTEMALSRLKADPEKLGQKPNGLGASGEVAEGGQMRPLPWISDEMNETEIGQIKKHADRVAGLLEPTDIPPIEPTWESEPPGLDRTNRVAQRIAFEQDKALHPLRVEYRKKVIAVLEDSWELIVDIFEHHAPQALGRLGGWRQDILDHTDPAKDHHIYWLECRDGKFGPNTDLRNRIENLAGKLRREAKRDETAASRMKTNLEKPEPDSTGQVQPLGILGLIEKLKTLRSALDSRDQGLIGRAKTDLQSYVGSIEQMEDMLREFQSRCGADAHKNKHIDQAIRNAADIRAGVVPRYDWFWEKVVATEGVIAELERWQAQKTPSQLPLPQSPTGSMPQEKTKPKDCTHSDDFSSVVWYGVPHRFTATQASCVALLWAEWEKDPQAGLGLREKFIGEKISSSNENYRLVHTFRQKRKQHPAWGTMIHAKGDGFFYLAKPAAVKKPTRKRKK